MPCFTVQKMSVELKAADFGLLKKAIEGLGYKLVDLYLGHGGKKAEDAIGFEYQGTLVTIYRDKITVQTSASEVIDIVKRAYSETVIKTGAEQFGWNFEKTGEGEITLEARF